MKTFDINNKFPIPVIKLVFSLWIFLLIKFLKDVMTGRAIGFPNCFSLLFLVLKNARTRLDLLSARLKNGPIVRSFTTSRRKLRLCSD